MSTEPKARGGKRRKEDVVFAADNIENTAPVNKILDELQYKNSQAYSFYCHNLRQRHARASVRNFHYVVPGHPLHRFPSDWDGELNNEYFESFTYKSVVKMITSVANIGKMDPLTEYMKKKADWRHNLKRLRQVAAIRRQINKYEILNEDVWYCPKTFVELAMELDSEPDPYFDCSYNWYYAGNGNMQLVCINWVDYLLHSQFNTVYLTEFSKDDLVINSTHTATYECEENENILEIISSENIVAVRTKNKIIILKIKTDEEKISIEKLKAMESQLPYTSINFDKFHNNILYVTTLDNQLAIVNIDRLKARTLKLKCKIESLVDNWNTVAATERTYFTHVNTNSATIYDKRVNHPVMHCWQDIKNVVDEVTCNDISVVRQEAGTKTLYFGTNHHLFLMDIRCNSHTKPKVVQRWTHGMQSPPTYISQCNFEFNRELLSLSSQWCEDMCLVSNYMDSVSKGLPHGIMMPYRPKGLLSVLNEARESLLCCDINNLIEARLCTSITGQFIIENGDKYYVLMQNSLGDISCHTLYPDHLELFVEDDSVQQLAEWSKSYQLEEKTFEVTNIVDISNVWNKLKIVPDDYQLVAKEENAKKCKFSEKETMEAFENDIDEGLKEAWFKDQDTTVPDQSNISLRLMYEDSE